MRGANFSYESIANRIWIGIVSLSASVQFAYRARARNQTIYEMKRFQTTSVSV